MPRTWPQNAVPKQIHLDLRVGDLDASQAELTAVGALLAEYEPHPDRYRAFVELAGPPFFACRTADWA